MGKQTTPVGAHTRTHHVEHHWGEDQPSDPHNPMLDEQGRVWLTSSIRAPANPDWCREGSSNAYARYYPIESAGHGIPINPGNDPAAADQCGITGDYMIPSGICASYHIARFWRLVPP